MNILKFILVSAAIFCISIPALAQQTLQSDSARKADSIKAYALERALEVKKSDSIKKTKADSLKSWHFDGIINVAFSQVSLTNWAAGGQNSIGLVSIVSLHATYSKNKISWLNSIDMGYGFQKLDNNPAQKSIDKIEATSNIGYKAFDHTLAGILVNFKSQFAPGYQYPNNDSILQSNFMAPGYLTIAAGLTYAPNKSLSIFVSPATLKYTFVENQALANTGAYGVTPAVYDSGRLVTPGKEVLVQVGAYFKGDYTATIMKNITLSTDLSLFSDYLKNPQDIVVDWTTLIQMKINKYISVTINTELIYDQNIMIPLYNSDNIVIGKGPRTQFKDLSGVGLAYNL